MTILDIESELKKRRGKLEYLRSEEQRLNNQLLEVKTSRSHAEEAQRIIQHVAQATQKELEYHVSELTTLAMASIFPEPYTLKLEFELKRGQSEAHLKFRRGDMTLDDPTMESGGGVVDVAAFALRVSLWSLARPRTRNVIVLDEPLRFLSRDLQAKASAMIKELSRRLKLQFIIVTHEENLLEAADKTFTVSIKDGVSAVKEE